MSDPLPDGPARRSDPTEVAPMTGCLRLLAPALLLFGLALPGCGGPTHPTDDLSIRLETEHFVFLHAPGDAVDTEWQERYQGWLEHELALAPNRRIEYRKYRDATHKRLHTGDGGNASAEPAAWRVHTIWPRDNHEVVHVLVNNLVGEAPALFSEGVAVAHQADPVGGDGTARWSGTPLHDLARGFLEEGALPALDDVVTSTAFRKHPDAITYPSAGSFVRFLVDERGRHALWDFLRATSPGDGSDAVRSSFVDSYGVSLDLVWRDWREFLVGS